MKEIADMLFNSGVSKLIIVGPVPQWQPSLPEVIANRHWNKDFSYLDDQSIDKSIIELDVRLRAVDFNSDKIKYLSLIKELCIEKKCLAKVPESEELLIWDYGHLTNEGATFIVEQFVAPNLPLN